MLISRVEEGMSAEGRPEGDAVEYQTASELFDMMAQNHSFEEVSETLSTRDLVILYENIDLGTKLMSNAEEYKLNRRPNQYVETIVYNEDLDSDGSDSTDNYSNEHFHDVFSTGKERNDMLRTRTSLENTLCQKIGDLEIQASNLSFQYDQHFLFKDPYIKEQLKNLSHVGGEFEGSALPPSLLDYICCKRLEDNYNFYMDNIIRYVKHTIDQLKRISNGDYLTDKAKEKWREVEDVTRVEDKSKVLATSTSIPLQVECKVNGLTTTWDEIIHSEVDIRSLSKILEKKIILEVPKLIYGSYKLFSKLCADNLVISCKREKVIPTENEKESRVDVVLQLGRSETGQVVSNISSIMILQPTPPPILSVGCPKILPLPFSQNKQENLGKKKVQIIEIAEIKQEQINESITDHSNDTGGAEIGQDSSAFDTMADDDTNFFSESKNNSLQSGDSNVALKDILDTRAIPNIFREEAPFDFISPDDLSLSMHKLNMSCLPEESGDDANVSYPINKKKSQTKVRIKSPYENKSHAIEEKKRKKLLEIRERREKRKMAVNENCKITKHRYGKGAIMPQASSSVTKLSITNKSFYNSIYGQNMNINLEKQLNNSRGRRSKRELMIDTPLDNLDGECESPMLTPEKNNKKYINRSYYLDEAVTEMMYTEMKPSECGSFREIFSGPPSVTSGDFGANLSNISQIVHSPESKEINTVHHNLSRLDECPGGNQGTNILFKTSSRNRLNVPAPTNSPKDEEEENKEAKMPPPSVECRKSIDKLYDLMKKIRKVDHLELKPSISKLFHNANKFDLRGGQDSSTIHGSDSGTSLKHHLTSSNPSSFSFEKIHHPDDNIPTCLKSTSNKKSDALTTVVPKVIISSKQQTATVEVERPRKDRKRVAINSYPKIPDNPLKAISQLLHEFDSVQKIRHRPSTDPKPNKIPDDLTFDRNGSRPPVPANRRYRFDQPRREREGKERELRQNDNIDVRQLKEYTIKERKSKANIAIQPLKIPHQQVPLDEKHFDRATKKKKDILDEAKEAKGEAVRGPSKLNSRLNSLAQPKKSYVQAHSEEYQTRYGRSIMTDRLQRLASSPQPAGQSRGRARRPGAEAVSSVSVRPPPVQSLERGERAGRPRPAPRDAPCKQSRDTDAPDALKTKMVAVESYVKSHYGRSSPAAPDDLLKARAPLVPADLDIASVPSSPTGEESTTLGNKLHYMINSMINTKPSPLGALLEAHETSSKGSRMKDDMVSITLQDFPHEHASSVDSDYRADIFEDKNVKTAVESFKDKVDEPVAEVDSSKSFIEYEGESCNSSLEIQKLEEALNCRVSATTFQKRLTIQNFVLTPKQSKQVLFLKSGDAGSIVLKSSLSKSLKISYSRSDEDVRSLANLVDPRLDWNFTNIPMQIATVGYAFPEYNSAYSGPSSAIKSLDNMFNLDLSTNVTINNDKMNVLKKPIETIPETRSKPEPPYASSMTDPKFEVSLMVSQNNRTMAIANDVYYNNNNKKICDNSSNTCLNIVKEDSVNFKHNHVSMDSTSSLDVLVGLLNEIQKITTCHMTNAEVYSNECELKELEHISKENEFKKIVEKNVSCELVAIASMENLRQLESSPSIYSLYLHDDGKHSAANTIYIPRLSTSAKSTLCDSKPCCVDKEVSADFTMKDCTNTFTDVPSKFFPITITTSTNISNSLLDILNRPSSKTLCLHDYADVDSKFISERKIIEITNKKIHDEQPIIQFKTSFTEEPISKIISNKASGRVRKLSTEIIAFRDQNKSCVNSCDFDPIIKMKRDILVTLYSMLVLTVFAALSFPEIMYHV